MQKGFSEVGQLNTVQSSGLLAFMLIYFYRKTLRKLLDLHANEREIDIEVSGLTISYRWGYSNRKHKVGKGRGKGLMAFNT